MRTRLPRCAVLAVSAAASRLRNLTGQLVIQTDSEIKTLTQQSSADRFYLNGRIKADPPRAEIRVMSDRSLGEPDGHFLIIFFTHRMREHTHARVHTHTHTHTHTDSNARAHTQ